MRRGIQWSGALAAALLVRCKAPYERTAPAPASAPTTVASALQAIVRREPRYAHVLDKQCAAEKSDVTCARAALAKRRDTTRTTASVACAAWTTSCWACRIRGTPTRARGPRPES